MRVSAAGNMPLQGLVKPPAKPVVMIVPYHAANRRREAQEPQVPAGNWGRVLNIFSDFEQLV